MEQSEVGIGMMKSPFKFLDPYTSGDLNLFFGREGEIEELFQKVLKSKLLLVYGASGTGKTSLIQCGLASRFSEENWYLVYIRRQKNFYRSLLQSLEAHSITKLKEEDLDNSRSEVVQRTEGLYLDHFKPIYLVFDQLEELFILEKGEERTLFYQSLRDLITAEVYCKIILIIREEYLAELSTLEGYIPFLFENRIRIEKMRKKNAREVIEKSCKGETGIVIKEKEHFLNKAIDILSEDGLTVELTYLQVYLDKLYRNAEVINYKNIFTPALIEKTGKVADVLTEFLEEQVQKLTDPTFGWAILKEFITKDGTKKNISIYEVKTSLERQNYQFGSGKVENTIWKFVNMKILTELDYCPDYFEFRHDSLAYKTFERLSFEEKHLRDISSLIEQHYRYYVKLGTLMNRETILYIAPHIKRLNLDIGIEAFLKKSRKRINRIRGRGIIGMIGGISILSVLSMISIIYYQKANGAREETERARVEVQIQQTKYKQEKRSRLAIEIQIHFENAETYLKAGYPEMALKELDLAIAMDSSAVTLEKVKRFKLKSGI